jgi:hypothetical protein
MATSQISQHATQQEATEETRKEWTSQKQGYERSFQERMQAEEAESSSQETAYSSKERKLPSYQRKHRDIVERSGAFVVLPDELVVQVLVLTAHLLLPTNTLFLHI